MTSRRAPPGWARRVRRATDFLVQDLGGGPRPWKSAWVINFQKCGTFAGVLGWYWVFGRLLISGASQPDYPLPDGAWCALCITVCMLGTAIMIAADAQKFYTLRERPGLITDGMFRCVRHPNYRGEMMVYGSFALMVWHWLPVLEFAWVWLGIFAVNMILKEASLSRHPEWAACRRRTGLLLPGL